MLSLLSCRAFRSFTASLVAAPLMTAAGYATTLTFDDFGLNSGFYTESGFNLEHGGLHLDSGRIHFDTAVGPNPNYYTLSRADGGSFAVETLDIIELGFGFVIETDTGSWIEYTWDDFVFEGYKDGVLVSSTIATSVTDIDDFALGGDFYGIDSFVMYTHYIAPVLGANESVLLVGDTHAAIDNITVSPVPLPASLPLILSGLMCFAGLRIWRRKQT